MEERPTPSVNYELMGRFVGQKVRLVCEIDGPGDGSIIRGRTSDNGNVTIQMDVRAGLPSTKFVEFIGTVVEPGVLKEDSSTDWGENFDMGMHNEAINLMNNKYAFMFNGSA